MTAKQTTTRRGTRSGSTGKGARHKPKPKARSRAARPTSGHPLRLNISEVVTNKDLQVRFDTRSEDGETCLYVEDLEKELKKISGKQLQPILVYKPNGEDAYVVIDGHRRLEALKRCGKKKIDAVCIEVSDDEALTTAFAVNNVRKALTSLDVSNAVVLAKRRGWSKATIEKSFGLAKSQLNEYEHLLKCPAAVKTSLAREDICMAQALEILRASLGDTDLAKQILKEVLADGLSARQIKKAYASKSSGGRAKSKAKLLSRGKDGAFSVRRFAVPEKATKSHLSWLKKQLNEVLAEIEKLEKHM